jgi:hypothetical protein
MSQEPQDDKTTDDVTDEELDNVAGGGKVTKDTCTQQGCM